ncbi:hypothetical protein SEUCBS139899_001873 [Sporothrix eucalyptigena]
MPTSRDRRDRSHHHSRSRSRSQERRSPNETDSGGKTEKPSADSRNRVPSPQNKEQLEHLVRRMLAVTLRKFESGSDKGEGHERREKRDHHERNEDRRGEERQETRAPDNDLAKLVLGQVLQFTVRRYLKNREKKRLQATKKAKAKMPKMPGCLGHLVGYLTEDLTEAWTAVCLHHHLTHHHPDSKEWTDTTT